MAGRKELNMDDLELVTGGIQHRELDENPVNNSLGGVMSSFITHTTLSEPEIECPKCHKKYCPKDYPNDSFWTAHVERCKG